MKLLIGAIFTFVLYLQPSYQQLVCTHPQCECLNEADDCDSCLKPSEYNRIDDTGNKCPCEPSYYDNNQAQCQKCAQKCLTCEKAENKCLTCIDGQTNNRQGIDKFCDCKIGFYELDGGAVCQACSERCQQCTGPNTCTECKTKNRDKGNQCLCDKGFYEQNASSDCVACDSTCLTCENGTQCTKCVPNRQKANDSDPLCSQCIEGYTDIQDGSVTSCRKCPNECKKCTWQTGLDIEKPICEECNANRNLQADVPQNSTGAAYCPCSQGFHDFNGTVANCDDILYEQSQVELGKRDGKNATRSNGDKDIGSCICDFVQNQCESQCCCDPDCKELPESIAQWKQEGLCISEDITETCIKKVDLYRVNLHRGMKKEEKDTEICIQNDEQVEYTEFIKDTEKIPDKVLNAKYDSIVHIAQPPSLSIEKYEDGSIVESSQGRLNLYYANSFGNCDEIQLIQFKKNIPSKICFLRQIKPSDTCQVNQILDYKRFLNFDAYQTKTSSSPVYPQVKYVYKRGNEFNRTEITETPDIVPDEILLSNENCACQNSFQGATYYFTYLGNEIKQINVAIWVEDIPLTKNSDDTCNTQKEMDQPLFFEVLWIEERTGIQDMIVSGEPGYKNGYPILAGVQSEQGILQERNGLFLRGINYYDGGSCIIEPITNKFAYDPLVNPVVKFGEDISYRCFMSIPTICPENPTDDDKDKECLQSLCVTKTFDSILLYQNLIQQELNIGQFGNADLNNIKDWLYVKQSDRPEIKFNATTGVCTFPTSLMLTIFYKRVGYQLNNQNAIMDVRIDYKQNTQMVPPADKSIRKYWFGVEVKFIDLEIDEIENQMPDDPSIIPQLPFDFFFPVWYEYSQIMQFSVTITFTLLLLIIF